MPDRETQQQIDAYVKAMTTPVEAERQQQQLQVLNAPTRTHSEGLEEEVERRRGLYPT